MTAQIGIDQPAPCPLDRVDEQSVFDALPPGVPDEPSGFEYPHRPFIITL